MIAKFEDDPIEECCISCDYEFPIESCTEIDGEDYTYKITWSSDTIFTSAEKMFDSCSELIYLDASNFNTSQITDMKEKIVII